MYIEDKEKRLRFSILKGQALNQGTDRVSPQFAGLQGLDVAQRFALEEAYVQGFNLGLERDFGTSHFGAKPHNDDGYNAFLAGLAGASIDPSHKGTRMESSYNTGLRVLLSHLGYAEGEIEPRINQARNHAEILDYYRREAEQLWSEDFANVE